MYKLMWLVYIVMMKTKNARVYSSGTCFEIQAVEGALLHFGSISCCFFILRLVEVWFTFILNLHILGVQICVCVHLDTIQMLLITPIPRQ